MDQLTITHRAQFNETDHKNYYLSAGTFRALRANYGSHNKTFKKFLESELFTDIAKFMH